MAPQKDSLEKKKVFRPFQGEISAKKSLGKEERDFVAGGGINNILVSFFILECHSREKSVWVLTSFSFTEKIRYFLLIEEKHQVAPKKERV